VSRNNLLYLLVGALIVVVAVLGYVLYDQNKEPEGVEIQIGPDGISVQEQ
jgi:hypothetical protein